MTRIFFPRIILFFVYIYIRENYNFFLHVTLEYAHHIETWADFMLEITGFWSVMDE